MALCNHGMRIRESDWNVLLGHAAATLAKLRAPTPSTTSSNNGRRGQGRAMSRR